MHLQRESSECLLDLYSCRILLDSKDLIELLVVHFASWLAATMAETFKALTTEGEASPATKEHVVI